MNGSKYTIYFPGIAHFTVYCFGSPHSYKTWFWVLHCGQSHNLTVFLTILLQTELKNATQDEVTDAELQPLKGTLRRLTLQARPEGIDSNGDIQGTETVTTMIKGMLSYSFTRLTPSFTDIAIAFIGHTTKNSQKCRFYTEVVKPR